MPERGEGMSAPKEDCPHCGGTGMVETESKPPHPPAFRRCDCVIRLDVLQNVEKAMVGLSEAPAVKSSPLMDREEDNLWITAGDEFLAHLRHVAVRKPITWSLLVASDAQLTTAWLASIALQGKDILDADAYTVSTKHITIPDLVLPPDLLVIRMGIKVTRNAAASECLGEALNIRFHERKPTWLWDQPGNPLNSGHLFWSDVVARILRPWEQVTDLNLPGAKSTGNGKTKKPGPRKSSGRKSLRGGGNK
jgi:hypothetical protein